MKTSTLYKFLIITIATLSLFHCINAKKFNVRGGGGGGTKSDDEGDNNGGVGLKKPKLNTPKRMNQQQQQQQQSSSKRQDNTSPYSKIEEELYLKQQQKQKSTTTAQNVDNKNGEEEENQRKREALYLKELNKLDKKQRKILQYKRKEDDRNCNTIINAGLQKNWYKVLGLEYSFSRRLWNAFLSFVLRNGSSSNYNHITTPQIKKSYRNLSKSIHPDKNKSPLAENAFALLQTANEILTDTDLRRKYDVKIEVYEVNRNHAISESLGRGAAVVWGVFGGMVGVLVGPVGRILVVLGVLVL